MKKSKISILLLVMVMILAISAVSAADIDDTSDSAIQAVDEAPVEEVASEDVDALAATDNTDVLADVGNNFTSLQSSIDTGTVVMDKDYARVEGESTLSISKDVTIEGNGHKIDGSNLGGIFNVNSGCTLTLNGVTLINGNAENGGAVYNNGGTLVIENSYFINNTATKSGGAIYNNGGTLNVIGSTFDGNDLTDRSTNGWGGAAIYDNAGTVLISTSRITNNLKDIVHRGGTGQYTGDLSGAAVTSKNGALTVSDSYFGKNSGSYGGAILSQGDSAVLNVVGSTFEDNFAFNGGAINIVSSKYTISNSTFRGNNAKGTGSSTSNYANGGAICAQENDNDDGVISDCTFKDNTAAIGGAITTQIALVTGCTFTNNTALASNSENYNGKVNNRGGFGGAIYNDNTITIEDSNFTDSIGRGRGLDLKNADISGSSFTNTIINVNNRGTVSVSDNVYDNDGKDISSTSGCTVAVTVGNGEVPYVTSGTIIFDGDLTFQDLQDIVDAGNTAITLTGNVLKSDEEEQTFANGILISHSVSIYAQDHTITSNSGKVFTVNEGATLTLDKANVVGDGTSAIVNNGKVTLKVANPSTFTNVGEFAIDNQGTVSQSSMTNFTQLSDLIALVNGGEIDIGSSKLTKADDEKATFADGIVVEKDLTITGLVNYKGEISTYLDAANSGRIFSVNDGATLTLNKMILKNGNAENGGAVYVEANNNLIANTVDFIDNVASEYDGGAIYTVGGTIALTDCVLDGNDVTKLETSASQSRGGAAIYAKDAQLTLVNTNVTNNGRSELDRTKGDLVNAVINLINSNAAITGGLFENNTGIYGGAIFADGDGSQTLTVSGATFKNNKAYNGGAIDISSMITDISDCTFDNNWVVGPGSTGYYALGGAVATDGSGSFSLADCNFTGNRATGLNASAGAVSAGLNQGCPATIDGCVFKENTAELKGGAVFIAGYDDDATVSNCNFSDDNAAEIGSSLYNGGNLKLTNNVIEGDSGIYSSGAGKIDTHVWVIVNDNQNVTVEYYDAIPIVVKITDDNGNLIRIDEPTLQIDLGDSWTRQTLTLDEATGFYTMDNYLVDQKSGLLTPVRTTIQKYFSSYNANTNLNSSYVTMIKADASMEVTYQNVSRPDDVVITINVTGKQGAPKISWAPTAATPFKVTVNDVEYKVRITNGIGTLTIPDLPAGEYVVNAYWDGNTKYNPIEPTTSILKVSNLNVTKFTVETIGKYLSDDNVTLYVTLLGLNGEGLNETFNVIVNNTEYAVTVTNGTGTLNISGLAPGHYSALGIFPGNNNYNGAYATGLFTVLYPSPILNVTAEDITYGEDVILNITLTEADGTPLEGGIGIDVGGKFSLDISINGFASIHVPNLPANESGWAIEVYYYGDEEHVNTQNLTETVKVAKAASTVDLTGPFDINIGENAEFTANIGAKSDVFVLNIWVDGKEYITMGPAEWYSNVASFMITPEWLPEARDYNITVQFMGNENYTASENVSQILTVNKIDVGNVIQISGSTVTYGENATVTVELPMDAEGNVTVTIPGVGTFNETVEGGIAIVEIPGLGVDIYELFRVDYSGDNKYASHSGMATVEVKQAKSSVEIKPIEEVTYGNNVTIEYTVLNATTIKINVAYGGLVPVYYVTFDANVSKYDGSLVLPNLAAGEYFVVVENDGNDNYTFSAAPAEFTVNKAEPTMQTEISPNIKAGDANVVVQVVLPENATGKVMLLIDGEPTNQMGYDLINGTVNITVPADFVNAGKRSYYVIYDGDDNYTSAYDLKSFDVSKVDPMVVIAVYANLDTTEPEVVSIFVGNVTGGLTVARATGQILIEGYGVARLVDLKDGIYKLELIDIVPGDYEINVTYLGDDNFNNASNSTQFIVPKRVATVEITNVTANILAGQNATFTVNMNPDSANGNVTIYIDGTECVTIALDDEYANATIVSSELDAGTYIIGVKYNGNDYYNPSDVVNITITVVPKPGSEVTIKPIREVTYGDGDVTVNYTVLNATTIRINVADEDLQPVYNATFDANVSEYSGSFVLSNLGAGKYIVLVYNEGSDIYDFSVDTVNLTVNKAQPTMQTEITPDIKVGDADVVIKVVLPENATGKVMLSIDEEPVSQMGYDLINGTVNITLPADFVTAGRHSYYVSYDGDDNYASTSGYHSFDVSKLDPMVLMAVIPDADTKEPASVQIFVGTINGGLTLARATGQILIKGYGDARLVNLENGIYTLELIDIVPDDYEINVTYFGDDNFNNASNSTKFTVPKRAVAVEITNVTANIICGENATFTVNMNPDSASGNVTIYINGTESGIIVLDDEYANATVSISGLGEGTHIIGVKYNGNDHYNASDIVNTTVTAVKSGSEVTIKPIGEVTYGNNVTIEYTVLNATTIKINVAYGGLQPVYNATIVANVSEYDGSFVLSNLAAGEYFVVVYNDDNDNYTFSVDSAYFTVNKAEPTMQTEITSDIKAGDEGVVIKVVLPENATGKVMLLIDGEVVYPMGSDLINGTVNITVPADFVTAGRHSYYVSYDGDDNYTSAYNLKSFEVDKVTPTVTIVLDGEVGVAGGALVNISVASDATGKLLIDNNGALSSVELTNGNYTLEIYDLVAGEYYINVTYMGDDKYSEANASKVFTVPKSDVTIGYETVTPEIKYGETAVVKVDISPDFATGNVTIFVDNVTYGTFDLDEDYANATILIFNLAMGQHNITVTYNGDENYNAKTGTTVNAITVTKGQPTIDIMLDHDVIEVGSEISVIYGISGELDGGNISIRIDGVECYNKPIASKVDYIDVVSDLLTPGNHTVSAQYLGDDKNLESNVAEDNVTVLNMSEITINIDTPANSTDLVFNVTLPSNATGYLLVDIADQHYYATVKNGTAVVSVPGLAPGNYTATVTYSGDDQYENITVNKKITVPSNLPEDAITVPETADTDSPVTYEINLPADAGGYLEVDVDGTKYTAALNNGSASVTVPALSEGEHNVTVKYSGDGKYSSASKDTKLSVHVPVYNITENKDVSAIYYSTAYYKVLVTKDGKAVAAGESVTIKYNGKTYTVKTDSKGYATLKLNTKVKVKKYTITAEYKGVKVTNKVTIKHVIKAKNKKVKKSKKVTKVKITLKKVNGKVLKAKKLKVKFRGKKYTVKTNKKGVATWKVKKSMLKKLKVGKKYKYKVTYGKDVVTKKLTIKK